MLALKIGYWISL